ncbi:hypothetical protein BT69DRAFT_805382 [Atractiella rhizophila]|nr:hypothetical protein BT69DRAFT_805382 [Atractiella rhizophila]
MTRIMCKYPGFPKLGIKAGGSRPPSPSTDHQDDSVHPIFSMDPIFSDGSTEDQTSDPLSVLLDAMVTLQPSADLASDTDLCNLWQKLSHPKSREWTTQKAVELLQACAGCMVEEDVGVVALQVWEDSLNVLNPTAQPNDVRTETNEEHNIPVIVSQLDAAKKMQDPNPKLSPLEGVLSRIPFRHNRLSFAFDSLTMHVGLKVHPDRRNDSSTPLQQLCRAVPSSARNEHASVEKGDAMPICRDLKLGIWTDRGFTSVPTAQRNEGVTNMAVLDADPLQGLFTADKDPTKWRKEQVDDFMEVLRRRIIQLSALDAGGEEFLSPVPPTSADLPSSVHLSSMSSPTLPQDLDHLSISFPSSLALAQPCPTSRVLSLLYSASSQFRPTHTTRSTKLVTPCDSLRDTKFTLPTRRALESSSASVESCGRSSNGSIENDASSLFSFESVDMECKDVEDDYSSGCVASAEIEITPTLSPTKLNPLKSPSLLSLTSSLDSSPLYHSSSREHLTVNRKAAIPIPSPALISVLSADDVLAPQFPVTAPTTIAPSTLPVNRFMDPIMQKPNQFNCRNFKLQTSQYARLSDIVIFNKEGVPNRENSKDGTIEVGEGSIRALRLAERFLDAIEDERQRVYGNGDGGVRYGVYIISDPVEVFERDFPEMICIGSNGTIQNKIDFYDREREEMRNLTSRSEIAKNVWLGNTMGDVPIHAIRNLNSDSTASLSQYSFSSRESNDGTPQPPSAGRPDVNPDHFSICIKCTETPPCLMKHSFTIFQLLLVPSRTSKAAQVCLLLSKWKVRMAIKKSSARSSTSTIWSSWSASALHSSWRRTSGCSFASWRTLSD